MNAERFRKLLDAYGANPARWPDDQRRAMQVFAEGHPEAQAWCLEASRLDDLLEADRVMTRDITQGIVDVVPRSPLERFVVWLLPQTPALWWRPAVAAALPVVLGMLIGLQNPPSVADWTAREQALLTVESGGLWDE